MISAVGLADVGQMTPQDMREGFWRLARSVDVKNAAVGAVENGQWRGPDGPMPYRIYRPASDSWPRPLPVLIFFHGGGGIFGSIDTHDGLCRVLTSESGCAVISVGYRLAPEHKFPAAIDDGYAATLWIFEHAREFGFDPYRIAIGGDSSGGGLAAVVCQTAVKRNGPNLALQLLICPVMDLAAESPSRRDFAQGYFLSRSTIDWMIHHYCPPDTDLNDPRLSPLRAAEFSGLPPAHVHTAEYDPLRDEGEGYADALRRAGVAARYVCHDGMIHHFYCMAGAIAAARAALTGMAVAMGHALNQHSIDRGSANNLP